MFYSKNINIFYDGGYKNRGTSTREGVIASSG
ncbi:Uncharacterised protein [Turicibacter sanguinis]|nr:Uncharacterised protein [Turicibacter sanguinis]CUP66758.1 Uncharacterised protein [Turicibacter sanguinis]